MTDSFTTHVPAAASAYCYQLWQQYKFHFRVVRPRRTRLGDFRVLPQNQMQITVNEDLNLYAFLITYVHEVAHAAVSQQYKRRVQPHGKAWQTAFQKLMQPLLTEAVFPISILTPLQQYMARPAATTYANPALMTALRQIDAGDESKIGENKVQLRHVAEGQTFDLAKKTFIRGTLRRTRVVCKEVSTGKSYAVLAHIWVDVVKNKE